jgi:FlaA1/EpsC-like NDP-sugar epimerase
VTAIRNNTSILITGGTGSFGHAFVRMTLERLGPRRLVIFSRDEMKQWEMAKLYGGDERVRFFIGDVRDKERLHRALDDIELVVHAAATKIVPTAEYNPFECVKTNIIGAMNLIDACIDQKVRRVVAGQRAGIPAAERAAGRAVPSQVPNGRRRI